ncbi:uncharacterized protein LOC115750990 [Rhodamnia argentea]|uniref:Uncharacterized protein LOC115750990 n=1 Tax=Rhodamnia argentea TaxID=178133 RepID=A0ABM3H8X6_9MYRT|nr:uncharacterized protein LOC115750990 [Rhodamnia argentea]XP_048133053.1 uncharacterized protein LOC115750990 [Rhodamnia argentea]
MLEGVRIKLMEWMVEKSQLMADQTDLICPRIRMKLDKTKLESRYCIPRAATRSKFEVEVDDDRFVVDLAGKPCACREGDISGIPCRHAISCIIFMKLDIGDYVNDCFKKDAYERCYQFPFPIMNGKKMSPKVNGEPIKPPPYKKKRMPNSNRGIDMGGPSIFKRQTRVGTVQISPSQASIDTTESSCAEESRIDSGM